MKKLIAALVVAVSLAGGAVASAHVEAPYNSEARAYTYPTTIPGCQSVCLGLTTWPYCYVIGAHSNRCETQYRISRPGRVYTCNEPVRVEHGIVVQSYSRTCW